MMDERLKALREEVAHSILKVVDPIHSEADSCMHEVERVAQQYVRTRLPIRVVF